MYKETLLREQLSVPQSNCILADWAQNDSTIVHTARQIIGGTSNKLGYGSILTGKVLGEGTAYGTVVEGDTLTHYKPPSTTQFTAFAYVTFNTFAANNSPIDSDRSSSRVFQFIKESAGRFTVVAFDTATSPYFATTVGTVTAGEPTLLVAQWKDNTFSLFLNNEKVSNTIGGSPKPYNGMLAVAASWAGAGGANPQANDLDGIIWYAGVIPSSVPDEIIRAWIANPMSLFAPRQVIIPSNFANGPRIHYIVYPSSETRFPQQDDVVKGWPGVGVNSGWQSVSSESQVVTFSVDASGLTPSTNYRVAFVWYDGLNYSPVSLGEIFVTSSGSIIYVRGLMLLSGNIQMVPTGSLGTGIKPLVIMTSGEIKERATSEGSPLTVENGNLRTLDPSETLEV